MGDERTCENVDHAVKLSLDALLDQIGSQLGDNPVDVMSITGPMIVGLDTDVRDAIEGIRSCGSTARRIAILLTTPGGFLLPVERMVSIIRQHYEEVDFIIPDMAMSAGTIFALSGDRIWMDYFSILGPIDPQVKKDNRFVPALSYLAQFEKLVKLSAEGKLTQAHAILLSKLDLAELDQFDQERELSVTLLKRWLSQYKFKTWRQTEARGLDVDQEMREERAEQVAKKLNEVATWHTHSRGISLATLESEVGLKIDNFGQQNPLRTAIRNYHRILQDYMSRHDLKRMIHGKEFFS